MPRAPTSQRGQARAPVAQEPRYELLRKPYRRLEVSQSDLENCLRKELDEIGRRPSWKTPLAAMFSIVVLLATTDFKTRGLTSAQWATLFWFILLCCAGYLLFALWKHYKAPSRDQVVESVLMRLKEDAEPVPYPQLPRPYRKCQRSKPLLSAFWLRHMGLSLRLWREL
jgi:hypothetical protein